MISEKFSIGAVLSMKVKELVQLRLVNQMPTAFLFFNFTFLFTSLFAQIKEGVKNPQVIESAAYDVAYATVPYTILKPNMPLSSLPAKKITDRFVLTNRIDTLGVAFVYDTTLRPRAFTFKPDYDDDGQAVAIQRKNDWVILDWRLFKPKSPAGMKMKWIDVDGKAVLSLCFLVTVLRSKFLGRRPVPLPAESITPIRTGTAPLAFALWISMRSPS